jgi:putative MATE family efflux protein
LQRGGVVTDANENSEHDEEQQWEENRAIADRVIHREQTCQSGKYSERAPWTQYGSQRRIGRKTCSEQTLVEASRTLWKQHARQTGGQMVGSEHYQIKVRDGVQEFHSFGRTTPQGGLYLKDLTQGSVWGNLLRMSAFLMASMLGQALYLLADMYWVGRLGRESVAAVGLAANLMALTLALTQMMGVGTTTLISHAAGVSNQNRARLVFNQSFVLSIAGGGTLCLLAFLLRHAYCAALAASLETVRLGTTYLAWFVPALFLQFPLISMGAALRGAGVVKPTVVVLVLSVLVNLVLAPILILGWGTGHAFGVRGAAMATFFALVLGVAGMLGYFVVQEKYLAFDTSGMRPDFALWREVFQIGLPAGAELGILGIYLIMVYAAIRHFGAAAQGGFAIGARIMQSLILPAVAVGMANAPIVGQNFSAKHATRVRESFWAACAVGSVVMVLLTALCQARADSLVSLFSKQDDVMAVAAGYLRLISLTFLATGLIFACTSVFQGLGNTRPPFLSSIIRLFAFSVPVLLLLGQLTLQDIWLISAGSIWVQAIANLWFLRMELQTRLGTLPEEGGAKEGLSVS